ncbi:hypothetical protein T4D_11678 [Trichinella pseudospiralis]|uniref:Uncharacterized protein n=1 Tax=Trichinella pseudospiralis TaxID=6337 RepID=A0A0V1FKL1_TRIPS|nr:hypothetical protein T4D_11678 [Trichinella pseudospiralis]
MLSAEKSTVHLVVLENQVVTYAVVCVQGNLSTLLLSMAQAIDSVTNRGRGNIMGCLLRCYN